MDTLSAAFTGWGLIPLSASWDLSTFLTNATTSAEGWLRLGVVLLGVIVLGVGIFLTAWKVMSKGRAQFSWGWAIGCLLFGSILITGGFAWITNVLSGTTTTIEQLGNGTGGFFLFF